MLRALENRCFTCAWVSFDGGNRQELDVGEAHTLTLPVFAEDKNGLGANKNVVTSGTTRECNNPARTN